MVVECELRSGYQVAQGSSVVLTSTQKLEIFLWNEVLPYRKRIFWTFRPMF